MTKEDQGLMNLAMQIVQREKQSASPNETVALPEIPIRPSLVPDLQHRAPVKELRTANQLAAMILGDLRQVDLLRCRCLLLR